jgi:hypothetical protein
MRWGQRLAVAVVMLGAGPLASGAEQGRATPEAIARQVQACLRDHYANRDRLAVVDRVFGIEERLGAYRAARTRAELVARINADLRVATGDGGVRIDEGKAISDVDVEAYALGEGLHLWVPAARK